VSRYGPARSVSTGRAGRSVRAGQGGALGAVLQPESQTTVEGEGAECDLPDGTGLGLSIVRAVARAHALARPEGGLTVTLRLPGRTDPPQ
jgi:signal transduction histidine kinase